MLNCRIVEILFSIVPLNLWKDMLIRHHILKCSRCQGFLVDIKEVKTLLLQEKGTENLEGIWPEIKTRIRAERETKRSFSRPRLRWAISVAILLVLITSGIWFSLVKLDNKKASEQSIARSFQINYIKIGNKPANAYLYQPKDSEMIFIWAEKNM